jgi:capsular polysaccharide biosynthesis protein
VNEDEVGAALKDYGFRSIRFEDYSFAEQVQIASKARFLVSNHGAGLTNMLFIASGSSVLELRKREDSHNNCYFPLASALDLHYFYQLCDPLDPNEDAHSADLIVRVELHRKNVEEMLAARACGVAR